MAPTEINVTAYKRDDDIIVFEPDLAKIESGMFMTYDSSKGSFVPTLPVAAPADAVLNLSINHFYKEPDSLDIYLETDGSSSFSFVEAPVLKVLIRFFEYRSEGDAYTVLCTDAMNLRLDSIDVTPSTEDFWPPDPLGKFKPAAPKWVARIKFKGMHSISPFGDIHKELVGTRVTHIMTAIADTRTSPKQKFRGEKMWNYEGDVELVDTDLMAAVKPQAIGPGTFVSIYADVTIEINEKTGKFTYKDIGSGVSGSMTF